MTGFDKLTLAEARGLIAEMTGLLDAVVLGENLLKLTPKQIREVVNESRTYQRAKKLFEETPE